MVAQEMVSAEIDEDNSEAPPVEGPTQKLFLSAAADHLMLMVRCGWQCFSSGKSGDVSLFGCIFPSSWM